MTIFEYGFETPTTHISVVGDKVHCDFTKVTEVTFRGYPMLRISDLALENCVFENCHTLIFEDCKVNRCHFHGGQTIYADRTPVDGCDFEHLRCCDDCVICLEDSEVSFCNFKDVRLTDGAYLINGAGDVWVQSCSFQDITTDREDRELFFCEETVGKIFKKKVQFQIVDTASCRGLESISVPENPVGDLWLHARDRGIRIDKAMDAMRDGISWDESKWNAHALGLEIGDLIVQVRVFNCLARAGLRTVGDLVRLSFEDIIKIKHLGKTVVTEVVVLLHSLGIEGSAWDYLI